MDRNAFLLSLFDSTGVGLEVSPSYNPLLSKKSGYKVETVDYATAEQLREKYVDDASVDISKIEEVDYVSDGASVADVIGKREHYDYIVASHVIEHIPDLLGFLKNCEVLLKSSGSLVLVVPDKRYCFDVFQNLTGTGDVLQAHLERRGRHTPGKLFDFIAYRATRGGRGHWNAAAKEDLSFEFTLEEAAALFDTSQRIDCYHDIHTWRFTPSSFRLLIKDLNSIGALQLKERVFHNTVDFEFFIILSREAAGCAMDRLSLVYAMLEEQKAIMVHTHEIA